CDYSFLKIVISAFAFSQSSVNRFMERVGAQSAPVARAAGTWLKGGAASVLRGVFSFPALLGGMLVVGVCASIYMKLAEVPTLPPGQSHLAIIEGDTWLHVLVGEDLLKTRSFPTTESYSFTAYGSESMAFEWLGQVDVALINHWGGLRGLAAMVIVLAGILS